MKRTKVKLNNLEYLLGKKLTNVEVYKDGSYDHSTAGIETENLMKLHFHGSVLNHNNHQHVGGADFHGIFGIDAVQNVEVKTWSDKTHRISIGTNTPSNILNCSNIHENTKKLDNLILIKLEVRQDTNTVGFMDTNSLFVTHDLGVYISEIRTMNTITNNYNFEILNNCFLGAKEQFKRDIYGHESKIRDFHKWAYAGKGYQIECDLVKDILKDRIPVKTMMSLQYDQIIK
jgi:hypothetical protein